MNTFNDLKVFAERLNRLTKEYGHSSEIYMCSSKIGEVMKTNSFGYFNVQNKYIMTFPQSALEEIRLIIDAYGKGVNLKDKKDLHSTHNLYGFDLYTSVSSIHPFAEVAVSSKKYTQVQIRENMEKWLNQQEKVFKRAHPKWSAKELCMQMQEIREGFNTLLEYMDSTNDSNLTVTVRRLSGIRHKVQLKPNTASRRVTYSNLLIAVSENNLLPQVVVSNKKKAKSSRSDSIESKYKRNPEQFSYYDKFGIFEVYLLK